MKDESEAKVGIITGGAEGMEAPLLLKGAPGVQEI